MMKVILAKARSACGAILAIGGEAAVRQRIGNIGHLLAGNFGSAALSLVAIGFAARALGPTHFGILALVTTFVHAFERFVSFQTWQPIIRYGAGLDAPSRRDDYRALIKFAFLLDLASVLAAWLLAVTAAVIGAQVFGWEEGTLRSALIYSTALLVAVTGTPTGVLRLAGRFRQAAYITAVAMAARLCLSALAYVEGWGLGAFVLIWATTQMLGAVMLVAAGARELGRRGDLDFLRTPMGSISLRFPKIWRFSIATNLSLSIRSSSQELDTLIVGALVGPAAAGFYHIAKRMAKFAEQTGSQIQTVVFPEIAKLLAAGRLAEFRRVVMQTEAFLAAAGAVGIVVSFALAGPVVRLVAGDAFAPAASLLAVQIVAVALALNGSIARAAVLAMGREMPALALAAAGAAAFFATAPFLIARMGPMGANAAHVLQAAIMVTGFWLLYRASLRRLTKGGAAAVGASAPRGFDDAPQ